MRTLISNLPHAFYDPDVVNVADRGARRFHPFSFDFDTTSMLLKEPEEQWEEKVKELHRENRARQLKFMEERYGTRNIDAVVKNAIDLGSKSFSLIAYHNIYHEQARRAFIAGNDYPALVAACALGERILNHLMLDMRDSFKASEHYKKVYRKESFDDWGYVIDVLTDWGILVDGVADAIRELGVLRNHSIHFNPEIYQSLHADALAALKHLDTIIAKQFGLGLQPWYIPGTAGAQFIKREYENHPFVRTYLIPNSGFVGHMYGMDMQPNGRWIHLDYADYGDEEVTDAEFTKLHTERDPAKVVSRALIEEAERQAKESPADEPQA